MNHAWEGDNFPISFLSSEYYPHSPFFRYLGEISVHKRHFFYYEIFLPCYTFSICIDSSVLWLFPPIMFLTLWIWRVLLYMMASQGALEVKNPPTNAGNSGDEGSIPRLGRSLGGGNGYPLQYSRLEDSVDREAWQARVRGVTKSQTWQCMHTCKIINDGYTICYRCPHILCQFVNCPLGTSNIAL